MVSPPAATISPLDHRGWVAIATVLGVVLSLFALGVRLFIRTAISPPFGMDDWALCTATVGFIDCPLEAPEFSPLANLV
jgi:hypothetical protein